jgi:hypothetical protein
MVYRLAGVRKGSRSFDTDILLNFLTPAPQGMSKFKTLPFWNAVSIAALTVVTAILYIYSAFLLSLWLLKRNKIRMGGTTARRSREPTG